MVFELCRLGYLNVVMVVYRWGVCEKFVWLLDMVGVNWFVGYVICEMYFLILLEEVFEDCILR